MGDDRILLTLKTPWADGTRHLLFAPMELLEKLAALTPRRAHSVTVCAERHQRTPPGSPEYRRSLAIA